MQALNDPHLSQKLIAIALVWCGLAALVYTPSAAPGFESSMIGASGFLAFTAGLLRFASAQKAELLEAMQLQATQEPQDDQQ